MGLQQLAVRWLRPLGRSKIQWLLLGKSRLRLCSWSLQQNLYHPWRYFLCFSMFYHQKCSSSHLRCPLDRFLHERIYQQIKRWFCSSCLLFLRSLPHHWRKSCQNHESPCHYFLRLIFSEPAGNQSWFFWYPHWSIPRRFLCWRQPLAVTDCCLCQNFLPGSQCFDWIKRIPKRIR